MPLTIKTTRLKYKDSNGDYVGVDAVAEQTTSEAISDITSAKTTAITAIENKQSAAETAVQNKGTTTLASIPQDYTTLSGDVTDLKENLNQLETGVLLEFDALPTINNNYPCSILKGMTVNIEATNLTGDTNVFFKNASDVVVNNVILNSSNLHASIITSDEIVSIRITDNHSSNATMVISLGIGEKGINKLRNDIDSLQSTTETLTTKSLQTDNNIQTLYTGDVLILNPIPTINDNYPCFIPKGASVVIKATGLITDTNVFFRNKQATVVIGVALPAPASSKEITVSEDIYSLRVTDNTSSTSILVVSSSLGVAGYQMLSDKIDIFEADVNRKYLYDYDASLPTSVLNSYVRGGELAKAISTGEGTAILHYDGDTSEHDSTVVIHNNTAYLVYAGNSQPSDNASSPTCKVRMAKIDLSTMEKTMFIIAKNGDEWGDYSITGGCGQPNIVNNNGILHIWFTANIDNVYQLGYCTFDTSTDTLSNYDIVKFKGSNVTSYSPLTIENLNTEFGTTLNTSNYHTQQANASVGYYDGTYYIGLVYGYGNGTAIIFSSTNLKEWDVFADYRDMPVKPFCELAVHADANGVFSAVRPRNERAKNAIYGIIAKHNLSGNLVDYALYKNCGSRPNFFVKDNNIYLFTNPMDRTYGDFIAVDSNSLMDSNLFADFSNFIYCYTTVVYDGSDWFTSYSGFNGVEFRRFAFPTITDAQIRNGILGLFNA